MISKVLNVMFPVAIAGSLIAVMASGNEKHKGERMTIVHREQEEEHGDRVGGDSVLRAGYAVGKGDLVDIDIRTGGRIDVRGWDRDSVAVVATLEGEACEDAKASFHRGDATTTIRFRLEGRKRGECDADFDLTVPVKQSLKLKTMGGDIRITDVDGEMRGTTMGGSLELTGLKGVLGLTTMGGDITLTRSEVDGSVKTMGGKVLLEDVIGAIKGESMGGNVTTRRVRASRSEKTTEEVRIKTMGGDINVDEASGGADVHTMGGRIRIREAAGHVKAVTMGGEIRIDALDGSVEATTMAGDIDVTMTGDPAKGKRDVELTSHSGDVTLLVPEKLSMALDLEIAFTRRREGRYRIESDFPVETTVSDEWERDQGDARKYIRATTTIGGGKHRIRIQTVNGNIILRKAK